MNKLLLGLLAFLAVESNGAEPSAKLSPMDEVMREMRDANEKRAVELAESRAKKSPAGDPYKWTRDLSIPGNGGWELVAYVKADGSHAEYGTRRRSKRVGSISTVWIRSEWRDPQFPQSMASYIAFDCANDTYQVLTHMSYRENDLGGEPETRAVPEGRKPVLPGTLAETWLEWACKQAPAQSRPSR